MLFAALLLVVVPPPFGRVPLPAPVECHAPPSGCHVPPPTRCPAEPVPVRPSVDEAQVLRWKYLVCAKFQPRDVVTALCVMSWESAGEPSAWNRDDPAEGSVGLFQVNSDWWIGSNYHEEMVRRHGRETELYFVPARNASAAAILLADPLLPGWHSWSTAPNCPHRHQRRSVVPVRARAKGRGAWLLGVPAGLSRVRRCQRPRGLCHGEAGVTH